MKDDPFGLSGQKLEGKYLVEQVVANGGFGVVYRGTHQSLQCPIAIKALIVPDALSLAERLQFVTQFTEEARLLANLKHAAIVRALDSGCWRTPAGVEVPWMVLEWMAGETLAQHLKDRRGQGGASPAEALALLRPVFEALESAHAQGVVHRDVKPANFMFSEPLSERRRTSRPPARSLRLLDFGIAKMLDLARTEPREMGPTTSPIVAFSLPYAAPEQASGMQTSPRTDVHALGLILTEVLTDAAPYSGGDRLAVQAQVFSTERPTPRRAGVDVGAWEAVIAKAVALEPSQRYADAGEFLEALEREVPAASKRVIEATVPVIAAEYPQQNTPRPSVLERDRPSPRSPRRIVLGSVALVAVVVALVAALRPRPPPTHGPPLIRDSRPLASRDAALSDTAPDVSPVTPASATQDAATEAVARDAAHDMGARPTRWQPRARPAPPPDVFIPVQL